MFWREERTALSYMVLAILPDPFRKEIEKKNPGCTGWSYYGISLYKIFRDMHECVQNCMSRNVSNSSSSKLSSDQTKSSDSSLAQNAVGMSCSASPEGKFKPCLFCESISHASSNCDNYSSCEARWKCLHSKAPTGFQFFL